MGESCRWRIFENQKIRKESFYTMLYLNSLEITADNFDKIASIIRNYASINEGVTRDFLTLSIKKVESLMSKGYWDMGVGQLIIEFCGNALI